MAPTLAAVDDGAVLSSSTGSASVESESVAAGTVRPSPADVAWAPGFALDGPAAVAARDLTVPVLLLLGVGVFLVLNGRAGGRDPRLLDAPLRARGSLRFPSADS